jgi:glycosyltransferase involved in cell wall biosynthesis
MKVSLVIPVYNEANHLKKFLDVIDNLKFEIPVQLVFVDDCSKDGSWEILSQWKFATESIVVRQDKNQGKGAAIRRGFELATGDFIGVQDADFEYSVEDIPNILAPLVAGKADVVFGSRFKKNALQVHRTFHYLINRLLTIVSNVLSGLYLTDMETCYKFFRSEILKNIELESNRFGFEPEITAKISRLKIRMMEVPVSYYPRNYMEGKKITWKDGVAALRHIVFFNLLADPKSYIKKTLPEHYVPHGTQWL